MRRIAIPLGTQPVRTRARWLRGTLTIVVLLALWPNLQGVNSPATSSPSVAAQSVGPCAPLTFDRPRALSGEACQTGRQARAAQLAEGFQETTVFSNLVYPTSVRFAPDGRIFIAEKSGLIKVFANLTSTTPTIFADLRPQVDDFYDRGLLSIELPPNFPTSPYVYVLYSYDGRIGDPFPRTTPLWGDACPNPPGALEQGCDIAGHLSRLPVQANGTAGPEELLIEDWCMQFTTHSIGDMTFGADGMLYVSGGEGAHFNYADYGPQHRNACGDPTNEGGAMRAQDLWTNPQGQNGDPVGLDGTVIRVDPNNPGARRIISYGLRNPFRIAARPGTNELWVGDVGWYNFEELNIIPDMRTTTPLNFGWPCYEGNGPHAAYQAANIPICQQLYQNPAAVTTPFYAYSHYAPVVDGEKCSRDNGSSITSVAFYSSGAYPPSYNGALFFGDYTRGCIWSISRDSRGNLDPATIGLLTDTASSPTDLRTGPGGDLFYVDIVGGTLRRIRYDSPVATIQASTTSGPAPLSVTFDGSASTGSGLRYAWDLNGDNDFTDATQAQVSRIYTTGVYTVGLRVTDSKGATDTKTIRISAGNTPPRVTITSPVATTLWRVGDTINFAGSATDAEDGPLSASALSWRLIINHCPFGISTGCHEHVLQTLDGVAAGSFLAPDHEYPASLRVALIARDSGDLTATQTVEIVPKTVDLTFTSVPTGLGVVVNGTVQITPFTRTVIVGSATTVDVASPQSVSGQSYAFERWSDGGARNHQIRVGETPTTYTAYTTNPNVRLLSVNAVGGGTVSGGSTGPVAIGTAVTLTANPAPGTVFLRWIVDGVFVGWSKQLDITMNADHTVEADFGPEVVFSDVAADGYAATAIRELAARGIILGYGDGRFRPLDPVLRAQSAALLVRALGWSSERAVNPFPDQGFIDAELWNAVAVLAAHKIALGYQDGTYQPTGEVLHIQVVSFIARAMVSAGYWTRAMTDDPSIYPNVRLAAQDRLDLVTFVQHAGAIPDRPSAAAWDDWAGPASRGWFAALFWQALNGYLSVDRVP